MVPAAVGKLSLVSQCGAETLALDTASGAVSIVAPCR